MNHTTITSNLHIIEQRLTSAGQPAPKRRPVNHLWIIDRSGSMYATLSLLIEHITARLINTPDGDTISIGWFSSEREFDWIVKGYEMSASKLQGLIATLHRYDRTLSTTCFSKILETVDTVLQDLSHVSPVFSFMLFTDGCPVVSDYQKEIKAIQSSLESIKARIASALFVGYGDYYNKSLMASMAQWAGGALIHSSNLAHFAPSFRQFVEAASTTQPRREVELQGDAREHQVIFTLDKGEITQHQQNEIGTIFVAPDANAVYYLTSTVPRGSKSGFSLAGSEAAIYAAAYCLLQQQKDQAALDVLGYLGDVYLIDKANQSFTLAEYGATEDSIKAAVFHAAQRCVAGHREHYVAAPDAFCLLDALELLQADNEAVFYPYHKDFEYKRIGPPQKTKDGYPKFTPEAGPTCPINAFTWHGEKLNLSLLARINGTVNLPENNLGFAEVFPTNIWRNFAIVKDGLLNAPKLPVKMSQATFNRLDQMAVTITFGEQQALAWESGRIYTLHLDNLPVMNRKIANSYPSAKDLCRNAWHELKLEASLKVYKFLLDELQGEDKREMAGLSKEQEEFLKANGIGKNGFAPPTEKGESQDVYLARELAIKIKGASSLPKVGEIRDKIASAKKLNEVGELIAAGLSTFYSQFSPGIADTVKIAWLQSEIEIIKRALREVRNYLNRAKFAVVLGKAWFQEFPKREDENKIEVDGHEYNIALRTVEVEI